MATISDIFAGRPVTAVRETTRRLPAVVLAALATHAVVYRSLSPGDGAHGYFGWYAPLAAGLAALSILGLPLVLVLALLGGRESRMARVAVRLVPRIAPTRSLLPEAVKLAAGSLGFLAVQETVEHSLALDRLAPASFASPTWVVLVASLAAFATAIAWVARALSSLVDVVRRATEPASVRSATSGDHPVGVAEVQRRSRPLAVHGALRAPPVAV